MSQCFIHTPAPVDQPQRGIILLVHKNYEVLSWQIKIPGRLLNVRYKDRVVSL